MNQQTKGFCEYDDEKRVGAKLHGFKTPRLLALKRDIDLIKSIQPVSEFWNRTLAGLEEDFLKLKDEIKGEL